MNTDESKSACPDESVGRHQEGSDSCRVAKLQQLVWRHLAPPQLTASCVSVQRQPRFCKPPALKEPTGPELTEYVAQKAKALVKCVARCSYARTSLKLLKFPASIQRTLQKPTFAE